MRYCLDTNTCIDAMRGSTEHIREAFAEKSLADILVPAMVRAELIFGALKSANPRKTLKIVEAFLAPFELIPFDKDAADDYAKIRMELEKAGLIIGPNDLVIAATARSKRLTLVTHNTGEFQRVPGLSLDDWV
jgi:tRNA(fMet)-specific endonuclease VapC